MNQLRIFLIRLLGGRPYLDVKNCGESEVRHKTKHWTNEELRSALIDSYHQSQDRVLEWIHFTVNERELERLQQLAKARFGNHLGRAKHMSDLEVKVKRLRWQVREMQVKAEEFNRQLYATGLIVNCTGCERGAPDRPWELTEDRVREVEHIAYRLREWWDNHCDRLARGKA